MVLTLISCLISFLCLHFPSINIGGVLHGNWWAVLSFIIALGCWTASICYVLHGFGGYLLTHAIQTMIHMKLLSVTSEDSLKMIYVKWYVLNVISTSSTKSFSFEEEAEWNRTAIHKIFISEVLALSPFFKWETNLKLIYNISFLENQSAFTPTYQTWPICQ